MRLPRSNNSEIYYFKLKQQRQKWPPKDLHPTSQWASHMDHSEDSHGEWGPISEIVSSIQTCQIPGKWEDPSIWDLEGLLTMNDLGMTPLKIHKAECSPLFDS